MFNKQKTLFLVLLGILVSPSVIFAQFGSLPGLQRPVALIYLPAIILNVIDDVWIVCAGIAIILFIWAGVTFLTANGAPEKLTQAKLAVMWGVIGVIVMILAFSIFNIAGNLIGL